jgi:hypothetical protein
VPVDGSEGRARVVNGSRVMRSYLVIFSLAASAAFASTVYTAPAVGDDAATVAQPVAVRVGLTSPGIRDEAAMVLVGVTLIGLAAVVRRAA